VWDHRSRVRLTEMSRYSVGAKLAGVIYIHRISDLKFGGLAVKNFRMFRELCGEKSLKNVVIVTNMWGSVIHQKGVERERELADEHFKAAIGKGAQLCRHKNTPESARAILRAILKNQPVVLEIQRELIDEGKDIGQTAAGAELKREILEVEEKYQKEIKALEEKLEEEKRRMEAVIEKHRKDSEEMQSKFEISQHEMEERMNARVEAQVRIIREACEAKIKEYEDRVKMLEGSERENTQQIKSLKEKIYELRAKLTFMDRISELRRTGSFKEALAEFGTAFGTVVGSLLRFLPGRRKNASDGQTA
jgi:cell division FtsZ-interacting protein ZapD